MKLKSFLSTLASLTVVSTMVITSLLVMLPAQAQAPNLALNKPVTCSPNPEYACASAVDGNLGTRWSSAHQIDPQWIYVDLGATTSISRVVLRWEAAYGKAYQIQTSNDATNWTNIYTTTTGDGGVDDLTGLSGSGRYIRMHGTVRALTLYGYSLWEFEIYGSGGATNTPTNTPVGPTATRTNTPVGPTPTRTNTPSGPTNTPTNTTAPSNTPTRTNTPVGPTNTPTNTPVPGGDIVLSYAKPATASSQQNNANCSGCTADKAFDMISFTRWASDAWDDSEWIYVDLSATATIHRVYLKWEAAYGKSYQIQTSNDAVNWTNIYSTTTGDGGEDNLTGLNGTGRYVRMNGTLRGTAWGWSLWTFDVYGTGGAPNPTPTPFPTPTPMSFSNLVWSDEFNAASLNTGNWTLEVGGTGNGNGELQYYTNGQNLTFTGSEMIIHTRKENPAGYTCWYGTCTYTSSRLKTQSKREFTYGRMEARLQIPYSQGIWPAFWMLGNDIPTVGWPTSGEIDIMENIGSQLSTVHGNLHGPGYSGCCPIGGSHTIGGQLNQAYHVYAVEWESNVFRWYIDSTHYLTVTRDTVEARGPWVYSHPFFFLLNVAVGGAWPGSPDASTVFPQQMKVDYVRVYQ